MDKRDIEDIIPVDVNYEFIRKRLYVIRGRSVMLDSDLAEIYGYENKRFKAQVRNNIGKFDDDFMFELTDDEVEYLRTEFSSANISPKSRYNPYAFTEQGLYMLMTVLKGELATRQSKALIRTFKKMKDYILGNQNLIGQREVMQLSLQTAANTAEIGRIKTNLGSVEKQMSDIMDQLSDVVTKSDLADMMNSFVNTEDNGWLMFNSKYCSADVAYGFIYGQAKKSIYLIDNYIGLRTLVMLKSSPKNVDVKIFSDNIGTRHLHRIEFEDFCREYPDIHMTLQQTGGTIHDRFIVLDYGTDHERIFLCGASSKDAGARITGIFEDFGILKYKTIIEQLLKNPMLTLS